MPNLAADPNVRIVSVSEKIDSGPSLRFEVLDDDGVNYTYDTGDVVWVTMAGKTWFKGQISRVKLSKASKKTTYDVRSVIDLINNQDVEWNQPRVNVPDPLIPEGEAFDASGTNFDVSASDVISAEDFSAWFSLITVNVDGPAASINDTKGLSPLAFLKKVLGALPNATTRFSLTPGPALFPAGTVTVFDNSSDPGGTHAISNASLVDYNLVKDAARTGTTVKLRGKGDYTYTTSGGVSAPIGGGTLNFGGFSYPYSYGAFLKPIVDAVTIDAGAPIGDPQIPANKLPFGETPPVSFVIERAVGINLMGGRDWQSVGSPKYVEGRSEVLIGQYNALFKIQGVLPINVTFRTRYTTWAALESTAPSGAGCLDQAMVFDMPQILKYQGDWINTDQANWDQLVAAYGALYGNPQWSGTIDVSVPNPSTCLDWSVPYNLGDGINFAVGTCLPTGIGNLMISQIAIQDVEKGIIRLWVGPFQPTQNPFAPPFYPSRQKGESTPALGGGGGGGGGEGKPDDDKGGEAKDPKKGNEIGDPAGPGGEGGAAIAKKEIVEKPKTTKTDGAESTYTEYETIKVLDANATGTEITLCDSSGTEFTITVYTSDDFIDYEVVDSVTIGQITSD